MKTPDVNVLVYAVNRDAREHETAVAWLEDAVSGPEICGMTWFALTGFMCITTNRSILPRPLESSRALDLVDLWLSNSGVSVIGPGSQHLTILRQLTSTHEPIGPEISDLHLAAIAIEHKATLGTFNSDFHRFGSLQLDYLGARSG